MYISTTSICIFKSLKCMYYKCEICFSVCFGIIPHCQVSLGIHFLKIVSYLEILPLTAHLVAGRQLKLFSPVLVIKALFYLISLDKSPSVDQPWTVLPLKTTGPHTAYLTGAAGNQQRKRYTVHH